MPGAAFGPAPCMGAVALLKFNLPKHFACANGQVAAPAAERTPDMAQKWVLTWFAKSTGARRERREFDDRESAVIFAMEELEEFQRSEAELLPPGGSRPLSFADIERVYASY